VGTSFGLKTCILDSGNITMLVILYGKHLVIYMEIILQTYWNQNNERTNLEISPTVLKP
jgi:hypothetical protein